MAVRLAVRDAAADFVQACGPAEFAQCVGVIAVAGLGKQGAGYLRHPLGLCFVHSKALHQRAYGGGSQVGGGLLAVEQIVQSALAQGALRHLHTVNLQQLKHGAQHTEPAANDGAALFLEPFQAQPVSALGAQHALLQPVQPFGGDGAGRMACCGQHVAHGAYRARGAVGHFPVFGAVSVQGLVQHGFGRDFCGVEGLGRKHTLRKIPR